MAELNHPLPLRSSEPESDMQLQRLNMDNTWFVQLGKCGILIDPWLQGTEVDYFPWFNTQWHRTPPLPDHQVPDYDVVLITQKYPDHFHKKTLQQLNPKRVMITRSIEKAMRKLLPQAEILVFDRANPSIKLNGTRITWHPSHRKIDPIYDAFMIADDQESIFLAPHGYSLQNSNLQFNLPVKLLISPFNEFKLPKVLGGLVSPGIKGLKQLTSALKPTYIVATHDEDKHAKGLVIRMAKIKRITSNELSKIDEFNGRILDIQHYEPTLI